MQGMGRPSKGLIAFFVCGQARTSRILSRSIARMDDEDALEKCDFRRATELQVAIHRADVEVTGEAGQTRYFSCSIGEHCRDGQVLTVEWVNATAAPTPAQKKDDSDGGTQRAFAVGLYISLAAAAALPFLG